MLVTSYITLSNRIMKGAANTPHSPPPKCTEESNSKQHNSVINLIP